MKSQVWLLSVLFLLVCCTVGFGEKPKPLSEITNSIGMKLKLIPAGEFLMGAPKSDGDANDSEKPQHKVRITKSFYLGVTEVTQAEYEKVMGKNPSTFSKEGKRADRVSGEDTSRHPVERVRWQDAVEFCKRLSAKEGATYRLPTEAEWEYACRAGTTTRFCFGNDEESLGNYAWFRENSKRKTHPVGQKKPNAWGLYDMHGNVFEWCQDCFDVSYGSERAVTDPKRLAGGFGRLLRGGSFVGTAGALRSTYRNYNRPSDRDRNYGFRPVRTYP